MRSVDRRAAGMLALLLAALAGCGAVAPRPEVGVAAPAARAPAAEAPVAPALRQEYDRALGLIKAGRLAQAEPRLRRLADENPDLAGPPANLGIIYYRQDRLLEAEEALARAARINPRSAAIQNQLGMVLRAAGRFDAARQAYARALDIDPGHAHAHLNIGILYDLYLAKPDQALVHYQRYQALQPREDQLVAKWIFELKQRSQTAGQGARGVAGGKG
ncbi:MAG TPA: tetratricopeptide repeat protein [Acidiferrobacterales bacterium]